MRIDSDEFHRENTAPSKDPIYVLEVSYNAANTDLEYHTSSKLADSPAGYPVYHETVKKPSGHSQRVDPLNANSSIGSWSVEILDKDQLFSAQLKVKNDAGFSTRGKRARLYLGYKGMAWANYRLVGTQIIDGIDIDDVVFTVSCADIQRSTRKTIFDLAKTQITASILATTTMTGAGTVSVGDTSQFEFFAHDAGYTEDGTQNTSVLYFKIQNEIFRATSKTTTSFTGVARAVLGSVAQDHIVDADATKQRLVVEDYVYLVGPALKIAYGLLTGTAYNQAGAVFPARWHLDIADEYVDTASFVTNFKDLYDSADVTKGFLVRFAGLKSTDGKAFLEKELMLPQSCFMAVNTDGALVAKRSSSVLSTASYVVELNERNIVKYGTLRYAMSEVMNVARVDWNWDDIQKKYTRITAVIDPVSAAPDKHGKAPVRFFSFRGIYGNGYTDATIGGIFDGLIDRFSNPPWRINVKVLPSLNRLEVGDNVRLKLSKVRDFTGAIVSLDRTFEIQQVNIDWVTGDTELELFGSSAAGTPIVHTTNTSDLTDGWYVSQGVSLATAVGAALSGNAIISNCTINATTSPIVYHAGPLTINAGATMTITAAADGATWQFRPRDSLTLNGIIDLTGTGRSAGLSGLGTTVADGGLLVRPRTISIRLGAESRKEIKISSLQNIPNIGAAGIPVVNLKNNAGSLAIPALDLRGSGGRDGFSVVRIDPDQILTVPLAGRPGGAGGGGIIITSRQYTRGASGKIKTSGTNGLDSITGYSIPEIIAPYTFYSGAGGGGYPGGVVCIQDGSSINSPDVSWIDAFSGRGGLHVGADMTTVSAVAYSPVTNESLTYYSFYKNVQYSGNITSNFRHLRAPPNDAPKIDSPKTTSPATFASVVESVNTPQTPAENLSTNTVTLTPPSDGNYSHSEIYYRVNGSGKPFVYAGPAKNTFAIQTAMDGTTYEIMAKPVSISGVESPIGPSTTKTVTIGLGGVTLAPGNYIRTNATAGDGTANGYGVVTNDLGIKGYKPSSTDPTFSLASVTGDMNFGQLTSLKYIKFVASTGELTIGRETKVYGTSAYNNDDIWYEWSGDSIDMFDPFTANSGTIQNPNGEVTLTLDTVNNSSAEIGKVKYSSSLAVTSFSKNRRVKILAHTSASFPSTNQVWNFGMGNVHFTAGSNYICFRFKASSLALYAVCSGGTETELNLSTTISAIANTLYEIDFTSGASAKFYVNTVLKGTITTNLPTGGTDSGYVFAMQGKATGVPAAIVALTYGSIKFVQDP